MKPWVEITTKMGCPNNCVYCPQDKLLHRYFSQSQKKIMTFEDFKFFLGKLPDYLAIHFSGMVEPFENPEAIKMILYAHEQGRIIHIYTTLRTVTLEDLEKIAHIPFATFTVHTPDKARSMKLNVDDAYLKKLKWVSENISNPFFMVLGTPDEEVKSLLGGLLHEDKIISRADNIELTTISPSIRKTNKEAPKTRNIICSKLLFIDKCDNPARIEDFVLLPDGSLLLCCMDYEMRHIVGNLNQNTYEEIINGHVMQSIENSMLHGSNEFLLCRSCEWALEFDSRKWKHFRQFGVYGNWFRILFNVKVYVERDIHVKTTLSIMGFPVVTKIYEKDFNRFVYKILGIPIYSGYIK